MTQTQKDLKTETGVVPPARRVPETVRPDWFVPGRRQAEWVGGRRIGGEVGRASAGCSRPSANRGRGRTRTVCLSRSRTMAAPHSFIT